jgi:hypothetical protein
MVKEMVMLVRRVNCFEVRRIKKVQFFAKKEDRRTFLRGTQGFNPILFATFRCA